jgi:hypothetical protein
MVKHIFYKETFYLCKKEDFMGLFWDLIQQSQIDHTSSKADSLETRVAMLEGSLARTQRTVEALLRILEEYSQKDINGDGKIGGIIPS